MTVGERIKKRRKELGISADTLAQKLNVHRSTIFRYEKGEIDKLPGDVLISLASALYTTPSYLMGWTDATSEINSLQQQAIDMIMQMDEDQLRRFVAAAKVFLD